MVVSLFAGCSKSIEQQIAEQLELGQKYLAEADYEEAIVAFYKAIELDPNNGEAYVYLGQAYLERAEAETGDDNSIVSDYGASIEALIRAMELDADINLDDLLARAYMGAVDFYIAFGDIDTAKRMAETGHKYMGETLYMGCLKKIQHIDGETLTAETLKSEEDLGEDDETEMESVAGTDTVIVEAQPATAAVETETVYEILPSDETLPEETVPMAVPETEIQVQVSANIKIDPQVFNYLKADEYGNYEAKLSPAQIFSNLPEEGITVRELGEDLSKYIGTPADFSWDSAGAETAYFSEEMGGLSFVIDGVWFNLVLNENIDFYQYSDNWEGFLNMINNSVVYPNGGGIWSNTIYISAMPESGNASASLDNMNTAADNIEAANSIIN